MFQYLHSAMFETNVTNWILGKAIVRLGSGCRFATQRPAKGNQHRANQSGIYRPLFNHRIFRKENTENHQQNQKCMLLREKQEHQAQPNQADGQYLKYRCFDYSIIFVIKV